MDDGHTYEKIDLIKWLKSNNTSPMTNQVLKSQQYSPNFALKYQIDQYINTKLKQQEAKRYISELFVPCNSKIIRSSPIVKIQMAGDYNTGKTSFVKYAEFSEYQPTQSTLGLDIKFLQFAKQFRDRTIVVSVRDIPGQFDRFKSMIRSSYRAIHGCILMCSVDAEESINSLKNNWIKEVHEHAPDNVYCAVVLNKYDMLTECGLDQQKLLQYQKVEKLAREFATDNGYPFYTTSCISGAYVHTALKELVDRIVRDQEIWVEILRNISNKNNDNVLDKDCIKGKERRCC